MCDYAAQYLVYYSVPPAAQSGVDREVPVVARPVAKIVQNIGGLEGWAHAQDVWVSLVIGEWCWSWLRINDTFHWDWPEPHWYE